MNRRTYFKTLLAGLAAPQLPAQEIKTDAGFEGFYGPVWDYVCTVVDRQLKPFLIGKDPLAGEALWDQMYRHAFPHSQGIYFMAMSAADNTLWDLRGRYYNTPVYRLLGGPTREKVECYASFPGVSMIWGSRSTLPRAWT